MTGKEFVEMFYIEKTKFNSIYFDNNLKTKVGEYINELNLTDAQNNIMRKIVDQMLTDIYYGVLLGLEGESSIGNIQQKYRIIDESGNEIDNSEEIEQFAFEYFQEDTHKMK